MFTIADGRTHFYQWDLNRQLIVEDPTITAVHFCNRTDECSLVVEVKDGIAAVPNIILQSGFQIRVFGYDGEATRHEASFEVKRRTKPADYVYTETEVKKWDDMEFTVADALSNSVEAKEQSTVAIGQSTVAIGKAEDAQDVATIAQSTADWSKFSVASLAAYLGAADSMQTEVLAANATTEIPAGCKGYAFIKKIYGAYIACNPYMENYKTHEDNPPIKVSFDGITINIPTNLYHFGCCEHNYIYFDNGKAYYHQGTRWGDYHEPDLAEGEEILDTVNDDGTLIKLAEPIITDISKAFPFDGFIKTNGAITIESRYNSYEDAVNKMDWNADVEFREMYYQCGAIEMQFEKENFYIDTDYTNLDKALDRIIEIQNTLIGEYELVEAEAQATSLGGDK